MKKIFLLLVLPAVVYSQNSYTVSSGNYYYYPSLLNINVGDTVFWINDGGYHNVNFDINTISGSSFNNPESFISAPTSATDIYNHVFNITGTYEYDCSVGSHAFFGMVGTIVVSGATSNFENHEKKHVIKKYDLLGSLIHSKSFKIIVYEYSDGTIEKRIKIN